LPESERTVLCSVLVAAVSGDTSSLQAALIEALTDIPTAELIAVDTADGAAIGFLGDPLDALAAATALRKRLPARIAIDLGTARLKGEWVLGGDALLAAGRLLRSAAPGEVLASASFYDMATRLVADRATLFVAAAEPGVYRVTDNASVPPSGASDAAGDASPATQGDAGDEMGEDAAKVVDAGTHLMISASTRAAVERALARLASRGSPLGSQIMQVGSKWMASAGQPNAGSGARVEEAGLMRIITGPSREAVEEKVQELLDVGAKLITPIEIHEGAWTAVCDIGGQRR
jgi:hypothetical protein